MKITVPFPTIFMPEIEKKLIQQIKTKQNQKNGNVTLMMFFSLWDCNRKEVNQFIKQANYFHPNIKFTAEISENQANHFSLYHMQCSKGKDSQNILSGTSKLIRSRPRLSKLHTSPCAIHQA